MKGKKRLQWIEQHIRSTILISIIACTFPSVCIIQCMGYLYLRIMHPFIDTTIYYHSRELFNLFLNPNSPTNVCNIACLRFYETAFYFARKINLLTLSKFVSNYTEEGKNTDQFWNCTRGDFSKYITEYSNRSN